MWRAERVRGIKDRWRRRAADGEGRSLSRSALLALQGASPARPARCRGRDLAGLAHLAQRARGGLLRFGDSTPRSLTATLPHIGPQTIRLLHPSQVLSTPPPIDPKRKREMPAYGIEQLGKAAKGCTEVVSAAGTWHALMRSAPDFSGWASETRALCMPQHTGARGQVTHVCNTCGVQCVCVQELDAILSFFRKSFSRQYDNAYYTGEFSAGGEREGQGILEFENGQRFSFLGSRAKPCCALLESSKVGLPCAVRGLRGMRPLLQTHVLCGGGAFACARA